MLKVNGQYGRFDTYDDQIREMKSTLHKIALSSDEVADFESLFKKKNDLSANQIMNKVVELIKHTRATMVSKDDFLDVRNEIGKMMNELNSLTLYKDDYKTRHTELDDKVNDLVSTTEATLLKQAEMIAR